MLSRFCCAVLLVLSSLFFSVAVCAEPPELTLANVYQQGIPLEGYWVSEKLDGVRAYWTGERFLSRGGHEFRAPHWFTRAFPAQPLDGELWMGRGRFSELSGAVRKAEPVESEWRRIRFMVFDVPRRGATFEERLDAMQRLVPPLASPFIEVVTQRHATSHEALMQQLEAVVAAGGEGLMLRKGSSVYETGRSDDLLKVKQYQDAEARVVGYRPGRGRFLGMMGSVLVELEDGRRFHIGTGFTEAERQVPPPVGSTITFKYYGETATGLPRFASYLRIRNEAPPH